MTPVPDQINDFNFFNASIEFLKNETSSIEIQYLLWFNRFRFEILALFEQSDLATGFDCRNSEWILNVS